LGTEARGTLVFTMNIGMMAEKRRVRGGSTKQHAQRGSSPGNLSYVTTARHHPQRRCGSSSRDATAEGRPRPLEGAAPPVTSLEAKALRGQVRLLLPRS
jgi:hypothetical protein